MTTIEFGEAFPGLVIATTFLIFALVDYGVACTAVGAKPELATLYFGTPLPVVGAIKAVLPLSMPMLLLKLVAEDVMGTFRGPTASNLLGLVQLMTLGGILYTIPVCLQPAIEAITVDGMTPDEATALYKYITYMLVFNCIMFLTGLVKTRLGATSTVSDSKKSD